MNSEYVAGFFDGEGSAMVLTVRRLVQIGVVYRFRPTIKIAQKTDGVLDAIRDYLGYGFVLHKQDRNGYVVNDLEGVLNFVGQIAEHCFIKRQALELLGELANYQSRHIRNIPYTREEVLYMVGLRDKIHSLNTETRSNISLKYPKAVILAEHTFVNIRQWQLKRAEHGAKALEEAGKPYRFKKGENHA